MKNRTEQDGWKKVINTADGCQFDPDKLIGQIFFLCMKGNETLRWMSCPVRIEEGMYESMKKYEDKIFMNKRLADEYCEKMQPTRTEEEFKNEYRKGWDHCAMIIPYWIELSKDCSTRESILKMLKNQIETFRQGNYSLQPESEETVKTFVDKLKLNRLK